MDLRKIKKLIELVEESGIAELEVRSGDEAVRIARPVPGAASVAVSPPLSPAPGQAAAPAPERSGLTRAAVAELALVPVRAPMAGTFYVAPDPDSAPFVAIGDTVAVGDVLCIIESMKMMNEIRAEQAGICREVLVTNGEPIGTGQLLFHFAPPS